MLLCHKVPSFGGVWLELFEILLVNHEPTLREELIHAVVLAGTLVALARSGCGRWIPVFFLLTMPVLSRKSSSYAVLPTPNVSDCIVQIEVDEGDDSWQEIIAKAKEQRLSLTCSWPAVVLISRIRFLLGHRTEKV